jgi:hypothetical protein
MLIDQHDRLTGPKMKTNVNQHTSKNTTINGCASVIDNMWKDTFRLE